MICEACGVEAPTRYVRFYQNIGMLFMRFHKRAQGNMCKSCIHSNFWGFTLTTLVLGWWGIISLIVTPIFIVCNSFHYAPSLGMDPVPPGAAPPELTDEVCAKLQPYAADLVDRLNHGENFERVAENISVKAAVTKGQVALYVHALVMASREGA